MSDGGYKGACSVGLLLVAMLVYLPTGSAHRACRAWQNAACPSCTRGYRLPGKHGARGGNAACRRRSRACSCNSCRLHKAFNNELRHGKATWIVFSWLYGGILRGIFFAPDTHYSARYTGDANSAALLPPPSKHKRAFPAAYMKNMAWRPLAPQRAVAVAPCLASALRTRCVKYLARTCYL